MNLASVRDTGHENKIHHPPVWSESHKNISVITAYVNMKLEEQCVLLYETLTQICPGSLSSGRVGSLLSRSSGAGAFCCRGSGDGPLLFCPGSRIVVHGMAGLLVCSVLRGGSGFSVFCLQIHAYIWRGMYIHVCVSASTSIYACIRV